jgi:CheY-like chemotaxis protein
LEEKMNKKILVVDDDIDVQQQMKVILDENGFDFLVADNVKKAWEFLENETVDLILLDVMMDKDSDGFNFAQRMKAMDKFKRIPIVMVTSVNQRTSFKFNPEKDGAFLPVEKFIEKPIKPDEIVRALYQYVH